MRILEYLGIRSMVRVYRTPKIAENLRVRFAVSIYREAMEAAGGQY